MSVARKPLIGISCCTDQLGLHPFHIVGEKYILGVVDGAGGLPLLIPALGSELDFDQLLDTLDGILFTERRRYPARRQARRHYSTLDQSSG